MRTRQLSYLAGFALCCVAVVMVPYLFPPRGGISVSVMAGFSNRAAQAVLLAGGLLFALWTRGWGLRLPEVEGTTAGRRMWVVPAAAVLLVSAASLYLWHWASNMGPYDEGIYFLDRFSNQMAGGRVYRDFQFDYGPLLYYPSWWLAAALHIPVGHAYYLFCLLEWVAGVLLLWGVIARLRARRWDGVFAFGVLVLVWFTSITDQGAQYTPLRFVLSSVGALWVHRLWQSGARGEGRGGMLPAMAAAGCCFTGLLLYSPEQGIGFAMATVLFFAMGVRRREVAVPLAGFVVFCVAVFAMAAHQGWMGVLFTFAGGSFNLPLLLGFETLFLIALLLLSACVVVCAFRRGESSRPEMYLVALALMAVPAAFGRADPGHIFINTMPALLVVTLALLRLPRGRAAVMAGWLVYIGLAYASHTRQQVNVLMHSWPRMEKVPAATELPPAGVGLRAPIRYFSYLDGQFGPKVTTGRYYSFDLVFPGMAEEKIQELREHPRDLIVVPVAYEESCAMISPETLRRSLRDDVTNLYTPKLRPVPNVKQALCDYIHTHYMGSPFRVPREEYRVMQPRAFPQSRYTSAAVQEAAAPGMVPGMAVKLP
ncbi:hypothetical protein [Terriglobus sp.]|uniref:hypothetical protein n=1 Tax=Terriglobus sp. TaxID=1889013 RepID=UPI003AFFC9F8